MSKKRAVFSVPPKAGQPTVTTEYGGKNVSQKAVAFTGKCRVIGDGDSFFGDGKGYRGEVLTDPTWRKLLGETERQITATRDRHHIFLEGFAVKQDQPEPGVTHIELHLGS